MTRAVRRASRDGEERRTAVLVTEHSGLADDVLRLAAAAGLPMQCMHSWPCPTADAVGHALTVVDAELLAEVRPSSPDAPLVVVSCGDLTAVQWQRAVELSAVGVVSLPSGESELVRLLADAAEARRDGARVLAVVGGCGGAGASVLCGGIAITAARRGRRSLLVDLDPYGGGADLLLGAESAPGLRWPDLAATTGRVSADALHDALPQSAGVSVLTYARASTEMSSAGAADRWPSAGVGLRSAGDPDVTAAVLRAARRSGDAVAIDLPRFPAPASEVACEAADLTVVVVPAELRGAAAAARLVPLLRRRTDALGVVVRIPGSAGLSAFAVADALGLPLLAELRFDRGVATALERGFPPAASGRGGLSRLCESLLDGPDHGGGARGGGAGDTAGRALRVRAA